MSSGDGKYIAGGAILPIEQRAHWGWRVIKGERRRLKDYNIGQAN